MTRRAVLAAVLPAVLAGVLTATVYGTTAARTVLVVLAAAGAATVLLAAALARRRSTLRGLRRQFVAIVGLVLVMLLVVTAVFVETMFVSHHDAFFTILVAVDGAIVGAIAGALLAREVLTDVETVRDGLAAVGDGARDVAFATGGEDEIAELAGQAGAMQDRLEAEEQARRHLVAAVSHDLRTPITSLRLLAEALDDGVVAGPERDRYLARMGVHVRQLGALIDDLFELSRLEAGDIRWSVERIELDACVREAVDAMRPAAAASDVAVRAELPAGVGPARGNPEQVQRVLFNLIQNAVRHTPRDGSIVVRAEPAPGGVEIEVADTGAGIDPVDRERVFEPFVQAGDGARTGTGAGLGLAIARAIVEAHGGRIWIVDATRGTRVRFSLPAAR